MTTGLTLKTTAPWVNKDGTLTKFGRDVLLRTFNQFQDIILSGSVTQAELDAVEALAVGSVTAHSDVTSAGSGIIISTAERAAIAANTAANSGSVTIHSDVTNAGSGQIITTAERALVNGAVQRSGDTMTGALGFAAGSATSPGLFLAGDTDTGFSAFGANILQLSCGGVSTALFTSTLTDFLVRLRVISGSASAPAYSFRSGAGPTSGMYLASGGLSTGVLGWSTNGIERVTLSSSGMTWSVSGNFGSNSVSSTFVPTANQHLTNKLYVDTQSQGSVTIHSDVTDAGSGQIITDAERILVNNALQAGTPPTLTRVGEDIILDDGEGGSSTVSITPTVSIPFYLEDMTLTTIALDFGAIPFYLENGTQDNIEIIA